MAIKRNRLDRKTDLTLTAGRVIDLPPGWAFTINCPHHGNVDFDFNPFRQNGREDLASHMRDAVWSMRHEVVVGTTLQSMLTGGLRIFWRFLDDLRVGGESITDLISIDRELLDRYRAWLEMQITSKGKNNGLPWSLATKKKAFDRIKALLINRQKRGAAVSPALSFPRNPFPNSNQCHVKREAYSGTEQKRILDALNKDLRSIHEGKGASLSPLQVLTVHLLLLALATGRNLQSLVDLRRDSLREHPIVDREILQTTKRRGWSTHVSSIRKAAPAPDNQKNLQTIPTSIGDHFRFLSHYTAPLIAEAAEQDRDFVFLWRVTQKKRKGLVAKFEAKHAVKKFALRHALIDDQGNPLVLNVSRLRPSFANELYRRTRDIRRVQQALGHVNVQTTARHYTDAPLESERDHHSVVESMVSQFTRVEFEGKVLLAADGCVPLTNVRDLLTNGYSTGIARCQNPFRENDSVCKKFLACFKCPSMCVFEDDLWRLFSFYYRLLSERAKVNPAHWVKTYGPIIRRIDVDIAPQFPVEKVDAARLRAQQNPHPTWRGPLL